MLLMNTAVNCVFLTTSWRKGTLATTTSVIIEAIDALVSEQAFGES